MDRNNMFAILGIIFLCIAIGLSEDSFLGLFQVVCIGLGFYFSINLLITGDKN